MLALGARREAVLAGLLALLPRLLLLLALAGVVGVRVVPCRNGYEALRPVGGGGGGGLLVLLLREEESRSVREVELFLLRLRLRQQELRDGRGQGGTDGVDRD